MSTNQKVIGVVGTNSSAYIKRIFEILACGDTAVTLQSSSDDYRISVANVCEVEVPEERSGWVKDLTYPEVTEPDHIAQILFSSGTEGLPKAILLSQAALANTTDRLIDVMAMTSEIREYIGIPIFYSFGFGRCRAVSKVGGHFYLPPNGFDPSEIASMLRSDEINAISAVPTLWRVLLQVKSLFDGIGRKLRWIEIGSQYMSRAEKEQLKELFPNARIVQHYGLTEASRTTFLTINSLSGEQLESVGQVSDPIGVKIDSNGQIKIRGAHLATALISAENTERQSITDQQGWLLTNDSGHIKDGFLYYKGRSDDLINCGGTKLSPDLIEQSLLGVLNVRTGIAVTKTNDDLRGEVPLIAVMSESKIPLDQVADATKGVLQEMGLEAGKVAKVFNVTSFPYTETGKLQRKILSEQYLSKIDLPLTNSKASEPTQDSAGLIALDATDKLVDIWEEVLKISPINVDDSFFDLGGDSLSAISVTMKMEKAGIPKETCRKIFEGLSISQIVESSRASAVQVKAPKPSVTELNTSSISTTKISKIDQLVAIWEEVLKVSPISVDDSFFDLGGDSLSAISVTMKMEKAGISKEACRRIFEGLSIAQIVESQTSTNLIDPTTVTENVAADKTQELVGIWEEVLKVSPISINDSFFDLGGDSLSAISVTMKMEKAGIPKESCRRIFEGLSISQIAAQTNEGTKSNQAATPKTQESIANEVDETQKERPSSNTSAKTPLASASESLNIVRGILVLLNVASHWMPGVIARLPNIFSDFNRYFATLYSSGTPGFAIVFGSGIGFFFLPRFLKDQASVKSVVVRNALLLAVGITFYAFLSSIAAYLSGEPVTGLTILGSFWSVLTFYLLAVLSLPLWLSLLVKASNFSFACLALASSFYILHIIISGMDIPPSDNPLIQFFVLVLTAKYNYFEMSSGVLLGAAAGNWIRLSILNGASLMPFALAGLSFIVASFIISLEMNELHMWIVWPKGLSIWTWPLYLGFVLVTVVILQKFVATQVMTGGKEKFFKSVAIIGIMAFPIFIAHELVMPVKNIMVALGVPLALPIALTGFFLGSGYLVHRLYSVYYGNSPFSFGR